MPWLGRGGRVWSFQRYCKSKRLVNYFITGVCGSAVRVTDHHYSSQQRVWQSLSLPSCLSVAVGSREAAKYYCITVTKYTPCISSVSPCEGLYCWHAAVVSDLWTRELIYHQICQTTAWVKKSPLGFSDILAKRLGIFSPNFTCLLNVPIYAGVHIFIQQDNARIRTRVCPMSSRFRYSILGVHFTRSCDVIDCVTRWFPIGHFLLVVHWYQVSISTSRHQ